MNAEEKARLLVEKMTVFQMAEQLKFDAPAIEELNIPEYNWWNEGLHGLARAGTATVFPQAIGMAATFDRELVLKMGEVTSVEARAKYNAYSAEGDRDIYKGLTIWSPNINIFRDPRWGRGHETYGEDPYLTGELGLSYVSGLQGPDKEHLRAAACAKHLAVHSGPEKCRHEFNALVSERELEETYLPAFRKLVRDGRVEGVMGAYNRVNGEAACASEYLMGKLKEWDFDGYFTSDCWAIQDFHMHHMITSNPYESAALALKSGCDVNCGCTYVRILAALEQGLVSEEDIKTACVHLFRTRYRLGILGEGSEYDSIPYSVVACEEHKNAAYTAALKSMVLLKNDGILPIDESKVRTIAVVGPNADSIGALEGNYCGRADRYIAILRGIQERFSGRVLFSEGCHLYKDKVQGLGKNDDRIKEAVICAKNADLTILVVGLDAGLEGEEGDTGNEFSSGDKNDLYLPASQRRLVEAVMATGKPVVLVTAVGSSINPLCNPSAWLQVWYPGELGGRACAQILFGDASPSGKLPVTFYENAEKLPDFCDYSMKNRTYRFAKDNILYPFGYGLTYSVVTVSDAQLTDNTVSVCVTNEGEFDTDEVLQVYVSSGICGAPLRSLAGFKRISLKAGESRIFSVELSEDAFTSVSDEGVRSVLPGEYSVYVGTHQPDELSVRLSKTECIELKKIIK